MAEGGGKGALISAKIDMNSLVAGIRVVLCTIILCAGGYSAVIYAFAQIVTPATANGSLVVDPHGRVMGSHLIAQGFTNAAHLWPRPSAVDFNAAAAGGSNKSPTSGDLTDRARKTVAAYGASPDRPLPADLAAASGSGLDPHITEGSAIYQAPRIAKARGWPSARVEAMIRKHAFAPGGALTSGRIVNVLELNLALDGMESEP